MRRRVLLLTLIMVVVLTPAGFARPPRVKRSTASSPALPPFPWTAVWETVGPILAIWLGSVVIRRTLSKEKLRPPLAAPDVASLPVAWFTAMNSIFEKQNSEPNLEPIQPPSRPESRVLTPDL